MRSLPSNKVPPRRNHTTHNTTGVVHLKGLYPTHGMRSSDNTHQLRKNAQTIAGEHLPVRRNDYQSSCLPESMSGNSEFCAIQTITDCGLGHYAPHQVQRYSFCGSPKPTRTCKAEGFSNEDMNTGLHKVTLVDHVHKRLWDSLKLTKYGDRDECFLTHEDVFTSVNELNIDDILKIIFKDGKNGERKKQICGKTHGQSRRLIMAILIMDYKVGRIDDFINADIYDAHLPLSRAKFKRGFSPKTDRNWSNKSNTQSCFSYFSYWKPRELEEFCRNQYYVFTPFLHVNNEEVQFYIMNSKIRLPFTEWDEKEEGGHGKVYQVKIHSSHHNFVPSSVSIGFGLSTMSPPLIPNRTLISIPYLRSSLFSQRTTANLPGRSKFCSISAANIQGIFI